MTTKLNPKMHRAVQKSAPTSSRARRRADQRHYNPARSPHQPRHRTGTSRHFMQWQISHAQRLIRDDLGRRARREARAEARDAA